MLILSSVDLDEDESLLCDMDEESDLTQLPKGSLVVFLWQGEEAEMVSMSCP